MDDYDWDALNWLEGRCMDMTDEDGKQSYPEDGEEGDE